MNKTYTLLLLLAGTPSRCSPGNGRDGKATAVTRSVEDGGLGTWFNDFGRKSADDSFFCQLVDYWLIMSDDFQPYLEKGLIGSIFNATSVEGIRRFQKIAVEETRLGIPILFGQDVIHGYKTIFPMPLAESSSWDLQLMQETARIAALEAASDGINWTFAPMVDLGRDARWGRVMEGAGEDPYLGSKIAEARVIGFQGSNDGTKLGELHTLLATGKHLAAYGAAESGRDYNTAELSEHTLRNVYLPPYQATMDAGVGTMMAAFNEINGVPATGDHWLQTEVLRNEWGLKGLS